MDDSLKERTQSLAAAALREVEYLPNQHLLLKAADSRGVRPAAYVLAEVEWVLDRHAPCAPEEVSPRWMRDVLLRLALVERHRHN